MNVDVSVYVDGFHGDTSKTIGVGAIDSDASRLMDVAQTSLDAGIQVCAPGVRFSDIGHAIEAVVDEAGFTVCREFIGKISLLFLPCLTLTLSLTLSLSLSLFC